MVAQCGNRRQARIAHYVGVRLVGDSPSRDAGKHLAFAGCVRLQVRPREWGAAARASFLTRRSRSAIASAHAARRDDRAALALERGESGAAAEIAVR